MNWGNTFPLPWSQTIILRDNTNEIYKNISLTLHSIHMHTYKMLWHVKSIKINKERLTELLFKNGFYYSILTIYTYSSDMERRKSQLLCGQWTCMYIYEPASVTHQISQLQAIEETKEIHLVNIWPVIKYIYVGSI